MDHENTTRKAQLDKALDLFQQAHSKQMAGEMDEAVTLYLASIELHPTAEAHTFLGWVYSFKGRLDEAIRECKKAIEVDPDFGNPYNDIGAYLIELDRFDEAIPWLERATTASRYESVQFSWFNLGRVYEAKEQLSRALECYARSLEFDAEFEPARKALLGARLKIN